ncbi:unnamed protein product, partial [Pleuronectes platessa]
GVEDTVTRKLAEKISKYPSHPVMTKLSNLLLGSVFLLPCVTLPGAERSLLWCTCASPHPLHLSLCKTSAHLPCRRQIIRSHPGHIPFSTSCSLADTLSDASLTLHHHTSGYSISH